MPGTRPRLPARRRLRQHRWVALDAAFDESEVDATHIKLSETSLDGGPAGATGDYELEQLIVGLRGHPLHAPAQKAAAPAGAAAINAVRTVRAATVRARMVS